MPAKNLSLHGNVPDKCSVALLLIDVINDFQFSGGEQLFEHARKLAEPLLQLKQRCKAAGIPAIYVNDNFGRWQSDFNKLLQHCLASGLPGRELAEKLRPAEEDYFVLKPKHSAFFSTTLDTLLSYLQARSLILTGLTADNCVLFTANDAYMRDYRLFVPADCVASQDPAETQHALQHMQRVLKAEICKSSELDLKALIHLPAERPQA